MKEILQRMSLARVTFVGVKPTYSSRVDVHLELIFAPDFISTSEDRIFLMVVAWTSLDQRLAALPIVIKSRVSTKVTIELTLDFNAIATTTNERFQFVYVQSNAVVGKSCPFTFNESLDHNKIGTLESHSALRDSKWSTHTDLRLQESVTHELCRSRSCPEGKFLQTVNVLETTVQRKSYGNLHPQGSKSRVSPETSLVWSSKDWQSTEYESRGRSNESFSVLANPCSLAKSDVDVVTCTTLDATHALRERDTMAKLYQKEKAIRIEQAKRNEILQRKCDKEMEENRKMKEELKRINLDIALIKSKQTKNSTGQCLTSKASVDHSLHHTTALKSRKSERGSKHDEDSGTNCDLSRGENGVSSLVDVFECPVCWTRFSNSQETVQFQLHVHAHFSPEDDLLG